MRSLFVNVVLLTLLSCGEAKLAKGKRPALPKVLDPRHVGDGVKFKLKPMDKSIHGEEAHARVATMIGKAVSHLTEGVEPVRIFKHAGKHEEKHEEAGLHLWYEFPVSKKADDSSPKKDEFTVQRRALAAVKHIRTNKDLASLIDHVEVAFAKKLSYTTDDPMLSDQMGHYRIVDLKTAWNYTGGDASVVVQDMDSGIDQTHPDLQNNYWVNPGETDCSDGIDNDGNGYVDDCNGYNHADGSGSNLAGSGSHGTHTAGTIAADNDNGVGVAGVAGGKGGVPGASLMINVVFGATDTDGFEDAFVYGADNGAHISSNSWGYTSAGYYDQSVLDAIDYADDAGVIVVFAAGNDGWDDDSYPGYYEPTIAVAALADDKSAAYFTNYGDWIDISAPGYPVLSTVSVAEGSYDYYSGTSMACPHVAGGLALAKSFRPLLSNDRIVNCLFSSAEDVDSYSSSIYAGGLGAGLMDIPAMLMCLDITPSPTLSPAPTIIPTPQPTLAPIICGDCSKTLTLVITTDQFPSETDYYLDDTVDTACFDSVSGPDDSWSSETTYSVTVADSICLGTDYTWTITDSYGDGICCGWGSGSYHLELDGCVIYEGNGDFGSSETFTFNSADYDDDSACIASDDDGDDAADDDDSSTCSELGWDATSFGSSSVCGGSKNTQGQCSGKNNYADAVAFCEDMGARLCTKQELLDDEAKHTGCSLDKKKVWSSTPCSNGYFVTAGSSSASLNRCKDPSKSKIRTRCCADV